MRLVLFSDCLFLNSQYIVYFKGVFDKSETWRLFAKVIDKLNKDAYYCALWNKENDRIILVFVLNVGSFCDYFFLSQFYKFTHHDLIKNINFDIKCMAVHKLTIQRTTIFQTNLFNINFSK